MNKNRQMYPMCVLLLGLAVMSFVLSRCASMPTQPAPQPSAVISSVPVAVASPSPVASLISDKLVTSNPVISIDSIVSQSACTSYAWKNRGKAPIGFIKGIAQVFAAHACEKALPLGDSDHDALAAYSMQPTLINTYTLLLGLGMRESSGNYGEGFDASAGSETASEAEAGPFQFSFNSIGASHTLADLLASYRARPSLCLLETFKEGAKGSHQGLVGSGAGADFQAFTKACPAFATQYAAVLIRVLKRHFGPLVRKEAEFIPACQQMLSDIAKTVSCK